MNLWSVEMVVPSIIGATENLLGTVSRGLARFSACFIDIYTLLICYRLPLFLLVSECSLLQRSKPEHSCRKIQGLYHCSQAQGWLCSVYRTDPRHAKGKDSLSGKPDVRPQDDGSGLVLEARDRTGRACCDRQGEPRRGDGR